MKTKMTRRDLMVKSALSFGSIPLQSLITGVPAAFLASLTQPVLAAEGDYKFLVMSHDEDGDPINVNMPGTYPEIDGDQSDPLSAIHHPTVAQAGNNASGFETPVKVTFGNTELKAAQPWSTLKDDLRSRMGLWHHGTFVNAHPDFPIVRRFNGAINAEDENSTLSEGFDAMMAQELHKGLGTILQEPIAVGGDPISYKGKNISVINPANIKTLFEASSSNIENMIKLRDKYVDRTYAEVKQRGTPAQKEFLDRMIISRASSKEIGDQLGELITGINGDSPTDQGRMIIAMIKIQLAPVFAMDIPFGGDNHSDATLATEVSETVQGMKELNIFWDDLKAANLEDKVIFATLNTFGRNFLRNRSGGRDHNGLHHGMMVFGENIKPGIVGGIEPVKVANKITDFKATGFNSTTTNNTGEIDIPFEETLVAVGKTLAKAVGISEERINKRIDGGKVITGALS